MALILNAIKQQFLNLDKRMIYLSRISCLYLIYQTGPQSFLQDYKIGISLIPKYDQ